MPKAMLIDIAKCTACRGCVVACKQWNRLPGVKTTFTGTYENPPDFSGSTYCRVSFVERGSGDDISWLFAKRGCQHCEQASCVLVCPTGATHKTHLGTVAVDAGKCIGCNYCVANCPFDIPKFDQRLNTMRKCTFCVDRIDSGGIPACAKTCPTGAITYGELDSLVQQAYSREAELKAGKYPRAKVYGVEELGGMRMMYVLPDNPSVFGLPDNPEVSTSAYVWSVVYKPFRALIVAAVALGLIFNRKKTTENEPA